MRPRVEDSTLFISLQASELIELVQMISCTSRVDANCQLDLFRYSQAVFLAKWCGTPPPREFTRVMSRPPEAHLGQQVNGVSQSCPLLCPLGPVDSVPHRKHSAGDLAL
jgi:hypothetical protein